MRKLLIAALLAGGTAVPAQATVGLSVALQLNYSLWWEGPGPEGTSHESGPFNSSIELMADSWGALFYTDGAGPFFGCMGAQQPCITATREDDTLSFYADQLFAYDSFGLTLKFNTDIETHPSQITPENFLSGMFFWGGGSHSGTFSLSGPVLYIIHSDPGTDNEPGGPGDIGAVPEPATWAMLIGGFALAGAAMRRRKVAVSFA